MAEIQHRDEWADRVVERGVRVPVDTLLFNPLNYRIHPPEQQALIQASLSALGWLRGILVNQRTGCIIDGHQRVLEADKAGQENVVVDYVDLSPEEEAQALATLDTVASMAVVDASKLDELVRTLVAQRPDGRASSDPVLDTFLQGMARAPRELPSGARGLVPEERLQIYEQNPIRQIVILYAQEDYEHVQRVLGWARAHYHCQTNTEAVTALLHRAWQAEGSPPIPDLPPDWAEGVATASNFGALAERA